MYEVTENREEATHVINNDGDKIKTARMIKGEYGIYASTVDAHEGEASTAEYLMAVGQSRFIPRLFLLGYTLGTGRHYVIETREVA